MFRARQFVTVVYAEFIPARFKTPLFIFVRAYPSQDDQQPVFEGKARITPVVTTGVTFGNTVASTVARVFERFLKLRQERDHLAPNLQDELRKLEAIFDY